MAHYRHADKHLNSLRSRLPEGPRFASESLDAVTGIGSVLQLTHTFTKSRE